MNRTPVDTPPDTGTMGVTAHGEAPTMTTTDRTATAPYGTPPPRGSRTLAIGAVVVLVALIAAGMAIGLNAHNSGHKTTATAAKPVATVPAPAPVTTAPAAVTTTAAPVTTAVPATTAPTTTAPAGGLTKAAAIADAKAGYLKYNKVQNAVFNDGGKNANRFDGVAVQQNLVAQKITAAQWAKDGTRKTGQSIPVSLVAASVSLRHDGLYVPTVHFNGCMNVAQTNELDRSGKSLATATRPARIAFTAVVKDYPKYGGWVVSDETFTLKSC